MTRILRHSGSIVGQGSVLLEVAGQPFFVLQGTVPAYRNLEPGETGLDVTELQDDLAVARLLERHRCQRVLRVRHIGSGRRLL